MAEQSQIQELSTQLIGTVEQSRHCDRTIQLGKNQKQKTELVIAEVAKNDGVQKMYRSMGRMFVCCNAAELTTDLTVDLNRINTEGERSAAMKVMLDEKRDHLTKQLNDLSPNP